MTADVSDAEQVQIQQRLERLGSRLRRGRIAAGLSVAAAAAAAGLSAGFISLIENGKTDASVGRLTKLLTTYRMHWSDVFDVNLPVQSSAHHALLYSSESEGVTYRMFPAPTRMLPVHVEIASGGGWRDASQHPGDETIYVLRGSVELLCGEETFRLSAGQAHRVRSQQIHRLRNAGPDPVELFVMVTEEDLT